VWIAYIIPNEVNEVFFRVFIYVRAIYGDIIVFARARVRQ